MLTRMPDEDWNEGDGKRRSVDVDDKEGLVVRVVGEDVLGPSARRFLLANCMKPSDNDNSRSPGSSTPST